MSAACANSFLFFMLLVRVGNASIAVDLRRNYTAIRRSNRLPAVLLRAPPAGYGLECLGLISRYEYALSNGGGSALCFNAATTEAQSYRRRQLHDPHTKLIMTAYLRLDRIMKKTVIIVTAIVSLMMVTIPLQAQNTSFLRSAPVAFLTDEDVEILFSTLQTAMNEQPDGETVTWTNSKTGHSGVINITNTHPDYDTTCRQVEMANQAAGRTGRGTFRMCKADDGKWKFAPSQQSQ